MTIEARLNEDGSLDEIVGDGVSTHLEQLDDNLWWLCIKNADGRHVITISGKDLRVKYEADA